MNFFLRNHRLGALLTAVGITCAGDLLPAATLDASTATGPAESQLSPLESKPATAYFEKFQPIKVPIYSGSFLKKGDRLAICGDSITEQRKYSRIIEDYLTMCVPQLDISVRQYGWSGEKAYQFLTRMTNDCLRFNPTIATTCYGMNDFKYRPYEDSIGQAYFTNTMSVIRMIVRSAILWLGLFPVRVTVRYHAIRERIQ